MYTRVDFGKELKEMVMKKNDVSDIGYWAHEMYIEHITDIMDNDPDLREILLTLNTMELGPEFELSYKRLNEIADDLILGKKNLNLDY